MWPFSDDAEWKRALGDVFTSSFQPRTELFAIILAHCEPADSKNIFDEPNEFFISDLQNRFITQPQLSDPQLAMEYVFSEIKQHSETMPQHVTLSPFEFPAARFNMLHSSSPFWNRPLFRFVS